jgi:hypothetical protein
LNVIRQTHKIGSRRVVAREPKEWEKIEKYWPKENKFSVT